ncbi:site-specific DNA-methyltransferase [Corynebacterium casei]|uniref:site-specific DNA-methyltransferase n=1 Tax=Corynebacterium casei TaxID=160386 RepID=UPI001868B12A|nr:site-specific DNA-methyltransferase [Corynebacterium casei]
MGRRPQKLELTWFNKDQALIPTEEGKYGYTWVDPKDPRYCEVHALVAEELVRGEQSPKEEGVTYSERADLEPTEDNLLVLGESGDVLEALTQVPELADKYVGQVKCVYIDPPFNTAQTFANYEDNLEHSIWLTMMRDRLVHLRKLLSDDGSIWVHLDDVENHRMRLLLDEIFGADNFLSEVIWQKSDSGRNDANFFSSSHDMILVYRKSDAFKINRLPRTVADNERFSNPDGDVKGPWWDGDPCAPGHSVNQQIFLYGIQHPVTGEMRYPSRGATWRFRQETMLKIMREWGRYELGEVTAAEISQRESVFGGPIDPKYQKVRPLVIPGWNEEDRDRALDRYTAGNWPTYILRSQGYGGFGKKSYIPTRGNTPPTLWSNAEVGHNRAAKSEIKALFPGQSAFATPKPERLLERILHIATNPGDIVLDVFAGSGTTAAVAHKMGRRWVTCELVEDTMKRFTRPRLEKVVRGEDPGGITLTKGERVNATEEGLPEGMSPEDAQKLISLLNKAISDNDPLKKSQDIRTLKALVKTAKSKDTVNWRGGGSFTVARLSPSCFDYDPDLDLTTLTAAATESTLVASVAANLGFYLTPEDRHFDGILGRQHLAVVEGVLDDAKVDDLMAHLPEGHTLLIAATIVPEGVRDHVRGFKNGSRVLHIPLDLFTYTTAQEGK